MKVILLRDVKGVGRRFDEKEVNDGYANNFLIPRKVAVALNASSAAQIKSLKEGEDKKRANEVLEADKAISKVAGQNIKIEVAADEKGHLFQKLNAEKISKLVGIDEEMLVLNGPIKEIGTHQVPIRTANGKETSFTLEVVQK